MVKITFRLDKNNAIICVLQKLENDVYYCYDLDNPFYFLTNRDYLERHTTSALHYNIANICDRLAKVFPLQEYTIVDRIF